MNFFNYSVIPVFVMRSGAALLNISNRTTILWSMLFDIVLFKESFHVLYFFSYILVMAGVTVFTMKEPKYKEKEEEETAMLLKTLN